MMHRSALDQSRRGQFQPCVVSCDLENRAEHMVNVMAGTEAHRDPEKS